MKKENLSKANHLSRKIYLLQENIKTLEWALSDNFKRREMSLNILNTSQEEGFVFIPASAMKTVIYHSLNESKGLLQQHEQELKEL